MVSLDEYLARYDVLLQQSEVFDSIILTNAELVIEVTDTDGDGKVSKEEFVVSLIHMSQMYPKRMHEKLSNILMFAAMGSSQEVNGCAISRNFIKAKTQMPLVIG